MDGWMVLSLSSESDPNNGTILYCSYVLLPLLLWCGVHYMLVVVMY